MKNRDFYRQKAIDFLRSRHGNIVGHHSLNPVIVNPSKCGGGNPEYIWYINPDNDTRTEYVASEIMPGVFYCHILNKTFELDRTWVISFGEVKYVFAEVEIKRFTKKG